mmetsp:Transcript_20206/g.39485  ORF Transcript_20206/g.39485 Transcript_20206/m.39485 type:complete len:218 (-) Transcript_20206:2769-3422(-)
MSLCCRTAGIIECRNRCHRMRHFSNTDGSIGCRSSCHRMSRCNNTDGNIGCRSSCRRMSHCNQANGSTGFRNNYHRKSRCYNNHLGISGYLGSWRRMRHHCSSAWIGGCRGSYLPSHSNSSSGSNTTQCCSGAALHRLEKGSPLTWSQHHLLAVGVSGIRAPGCVVLGLQRMHGQRNFSLTASAGTASARHWTSSIRRTLWKPWRSPRTNRGSAWLP